MTKALVSASPAPSTFPASSTTRSWLAVISLQCGPNGLSRNRPGWPRYGQAEVVVDGLVEAVEDGGAEGGGQLDPGPDDLAHDADPHDGTLTTRP